MSFYPSTYVKKEAPNDYMKLSEGSHRVRILTSPIIGFQSWKINPETNKDEPQRVKTFQEAVKLPSKDGKIQEFNAFIVWDYETKMIRLLNITQPSIKDWIYNQTLDEDWNDPTTYDIVITRTGKTMTDTRYACSTKLPKKLDDEASGAFKAVKIVPENYFAGGHPIVREETGIGEVGESEYTSEEIASEIPF